MTLTILTLAYTSLSLSFVTHLEYTTFHNRVAYSCPFIFQLKYYLEKQSYPNTFNTFSVQESREEEHSFTKIVCKICSMNEMHACY